MNQPKVLPPHGETTIDELARAIAHAPCLLGVADVVTVRSVVVRTQGDQWANFATSIFIGNDQNNRNARTTDIDLGSIQLIVRTFRATDVTTGKSLRRICAAWQEKVGAQTALDFQETAPCIRHFTQNYWTEEPCWVIDLHKRDPQNAQVPQGPFFDPATRFFAEDIEGAATEWTSDPTLKQDVTVPTRYRVIIPDPRAFFSKFVPEGNTLSIHVSTTGSLELYCCGTSRDFHRRITRHQEPISERIVTRLLQLTEPCKSCIFLWANVHLFCLEVFDGSIGRDS